MNIMLIGQCCVCKHWKGKADAKALCRKHNIVTEATFHCREFEAKEEHKKRQHCWTCGNKLEDRDYGLPQCPTYRWCPKCKEER